MKEVFVLGIGNRLMMDDGLGIYVVEELKKRNTNSHIRCIIGETDIDYCLAQIKEASYLVIVDAACFDKEPGNVSIIPLGLIFKNRMQPISVHESHLLNEIDMSGEDIRGLFIGIEPDEINYCPNLSNKLKAEFIKIVENIEQIIVSFTR